MYVLTIWPQIASQWQDSVYICWLWCVYKLKYLVKAPSCAPGTASPLLPLLPALLLVLLMHLRRQECWESPAKLSPPSPAERTSRTSWTASWSHRTMPSWATDAAEQCPYLVTLTISDCDNFSDEAIQQVAKTSKICTWTISVLTLQSAYLHHLWSCGAAAR